MMSKLLGTYVNGNTIVAMYDDGTKERYIKDGEKSAPEFPESIDLKITNRCDMGCAMCAEQSSPDGKHADLNDPLLNTLRPYTEVAIGGGNPLEHPDLEPFLTRMKENRVICNLTVNAKHFMDNIPFMRYLCDNELIHGIGISVPFDIPDGLIDVLHDFPNAVIHTIFGITPWSVYEKLANHNLNLLILGFKAKGYGWEYFIENSSDTLENFADLKHHVLGLRSRFKAVAFDTLAVRQMSLDEILTKKEFDELYMGDDGEFTMYIDLVERRYGRSSRHFLTTINFETISELFANVYDEEDI